MKQILCALFLLLTFNIHAALSPEQKTALDKQIEAVKMWAADAIVVNGVKAINTKQLDEFKDMTQEKWAALTILDPKIKLLSKNPIAEFLKSKKTEMVSEAFLSAADGTKVALLSKTTGWSHKGKAKHDDPMANKTWIGDVEVDESTSAQQIQVAVPVLDAGKPIGSLVVGFNVAKLK